MQTDYLIVGQGICGTWLSYYLQQAGYSCVVIDDNDSSTASHVASGIINPVTGRRIVRTWMIEELLPFAGKAYTDLGHHLKAELYKSLSILDFHTTPQMKDAYTKRMEEGEDYLHHVQDEEKWKAYFNFYFGVNSIEPCLLVNIKSMLQLWRNELRNHQSLLEEKFEVEHLQVHDSFKKVNYKNIEAKAIIFCDGAKGFTNPYFQMLPFTAMKGEALIVEIKDLPADYIYKQGMNIVPWNDKDLFWVGSSYEWSFADDSPTEKFRLQTEKNLQQILKLPFSIVEHLSAVRPANIERRPFVGFHPHYTCVGILNGMGTKGCSLAPYFAHQLVQYIKDETAIHPLTDIQRFKNRILKKV